MRHFVFIAGNNSFHIFKATEDTFTGNCVKVILRQKVVGQNGYRVLFKCGTVALTKFVELNTEQINVLICKHSFYI